MSFSFTFNFKFEFASFQNTCFQIVIFIFGLYFSSLDFFNLFWISNPKIEGYSFFLIEPFVFLFLEVCDLVSMEDTWHVAEIQKLSNSFSSLSDFQVVSSHSVKLAGPNGKWRNLLHEFISDSSGVQIRILLLFFEVSSK